jgi:hypothetical protein
MYIVIKECLDNHLNHFELKSSMKMKERKECGKNMGEVASSWKQEVE